MLLGVRPQMPELLHFCGCPRWRLAAFGQHFYRFLALLSHSGSGATFRLLAACKALVKAFDWGIEHYSCAHCAYAAPLLRIAAPLRGDLPAATAEDARPA